MSVGDEKVKRRKSMASGVAAMDWLKAASLGISVVALLLSTLVIPLAGWVWSTNSRVVTLELEYKQMAKNLDKIEAETGKIDVIQNDIETIKADIGEIKAAVQ